LKLAVVALVMLAALVIGALTLRSRIPLWVWPLWLMCVGIIGFAYVLLLMFE
jgi:hypothetical protein